MRNLGDTVFVAWATSHHSVQELCPVCSGKRVVQIVQNDGTFAVKCDFCRHTPGEATVYRAACGVLETEITSVENRGGALHYGYSGYVSNELGLFDTHEEAQVAADKAFPSNKEHADKIAAGLAPDKWSQSTRTLGYHRAEIRKAKKSIEWHETQIAKTK